MKVLVAILVREKKQGLNHLEELILSAPSWVRMGSPNDLRSLGNLETADIRVSLKPGLVTTDLGFYWHLDPHGGGETDNDSKEEQMSDFTNEGDEDGDNGHDKNEDGEEWDGENGDRAYWDEETGAEASWDEEQPDESYVGHEELHLVETDGQRRNGYH